MSKKLWKGRCWWVLFAKTILFSSCLWTSRRYGACFCLFDYRFRLRKRRITSTQRYPSSLLEEDIVRRRGEWGIWNSYILHLRSMKHEAWMRYDRWRASVLDPHSSQSLPCWRTLRGVCGAFVRRSWFLLWSEWWNGPLRLLFALPSTWPRRTRQDC